MKKSYNPFKCGGSYVGAILFLFYIIYSSTKQCVGNMVFGMSCSTNFSMMPTKLLEYFTGINLNYMNSTTHKFFDINTLLVVYGTFTVLFLIGWGIHSLFRRFK